jgi:hypothetical protein
MVGAKGLDDVPGSFQQKKDLKIESQNLRVRFPKSRSQDAYIRTNEQHTQMHIHHKKESQH